MAASFTALKSEQPAKMTAFVGAFIVGNNYMYTNNSSI